MQHIITLIYIEMIFQGQYLVCIYDVSEIRHVIIICCISSSEEQGCRFDPCCGFVNATP